MAFCTKILPNESLDVNGVEFKFKYFEDGKASVVVSGHDGQAILVRNPDTSIKRMVAPVKEAG